MRDMKNKSRDEEMKKIQQIKNGYDHKIRILEEGKELLSRKNQEFQRSLQEKERTINDL